jgi:hypothetical protein
VSDGGWSFGGSILTFAFPMLLFIGVAVSLYVLYTKPAVVPGRRSTSAAEHPVSYTPIPGNPAPAPGNLAADDAAKAADGENVAPEAQE